MALINSYGIWNNKGGVGKSTITFHLATRYAERNPKVNVLVIDLCPQANSSMMLLGGGAVGEQSVLNFCTKPTPPTVVGYLTTVITNGPGANLPDYNDFITNVNSVNPNLPSNLYLLCGDGNLEPISPAISDNASARALTPTANPWIWIHNIFKNLINDFSEKNSNNDTIVFIDTNPSFGIYTELAIIASSRLLCPINADDSSRTAANAMTILLHGSVPPHPVFGAWTFASLAQKHGIKIPEIHLIIGNRMTQFDGEATAFGAMSDETAKSLFLIYQSNPTYFTQKNLTISSIEDFRYSYSKSLRDFNTAGVVTAHLGKLLSNMSAGYYTVYSKEVKVNKPRVNDCLDAIDKVIDAL
ncbi:MAG: ParA family protein [Bacteroidetes bacterium]|nr:ParA family protein [Bacteroidota bacterium]